MTHLSQHDPRAAALTGALGAHAVDVRLYDTVDSTNTRAKQDAATLSGPTLYLARTQTAGRGRMGRSFHSPADTGLYMTLAIPTDRPLGEIVRMTALAAVATTAAVEDLTGKHPAIKWVNDLYLYERKLAGILTEAVTRPDSLACLVIGLGLNLTTTAFPPALSTTATALFSPDEADALTPTLVGTLVGTLAGTVTRTLLDCFSDPCPTVRGESCLSFYRRHLLWQGVPVTCTRGRETFIGTLYGVDEDYNLLLDTPAGQRALSSGEITVRPLT